ncbi:methyltransferase domain-containing protein [Candidatus Woesearchaeota archaeon]|nr:methyltransferase domain-containing protein [Candidatus Woesearchaeota archaeon]
MHVKKLAITEEKRIYPILDLNRSIHFNEGAVDRQVLIDANHEGVIKTTGGQELLLVPATFKDNMERMKQQAAIIIPKDIGFIIAECGLTKDSVVIDAGAGSGGSACTLGALCKKVYTYDINDQHLETVRENCVKLDLTNVEVIKGDITTIEPKEQVDLFVLDIPKTEKAIPTIKKALKQSAYAAIYTPHINQAQQFIQELDDDFKLITVIELIQRRWEVNDKQLRPKHNMLGHTAFLTIVRKFKK